MSDSPWILLKEEIENNDGDKIVEFLNTLVPSEKARTVSRLDKELITRLFLLIPSNYAADLLKYLPD
ncbi:MAG: hypothetical protein KKD07_01565 [Candidatus Omnitrophica bacterium]|nr:hypothetical protein [Candidatus Omnitrophota bacterium]MBU1997357.1 hypothetical protein [Candidatus Omnitrophota bacterium]MBU4333109.1 hypothetical protein [Candidatus Omnitrophota bacterium]